MQNSAIKSQQDRSIDFMRFIGIFLIVMAHNREGLPNTLFEFRSFDVPLMVFVSGLCFSGKYISNTKQFLLRRTPRLIIPLYVFLTAYFLLCFFIIYMFGVNTNLNFRMVAESYLLLGGIGFVWIIKVFLLIMLLTPALLYVYRKLPNITLFCIIALVAQTLYIKYVGGVESSTPFQFFIREFVLYATGYSIVFLCGLQAGNPNSRLKSAIPWFLLLLIYFVYHIATENNAILPINKHKYPPADIFLVYGCAISFLLNLLRPIFSKLANRITDFVGSNTMWIYLYHIPLVSPFSRIEVHWSLRFLTMFCIAMTITYLQVTFSHRAENKWPWSGWKYLRG